MTKIISTHSFRGGTGKSNVTANVAARLAQSGKRVAVFDNDIQSPGIHVIFNFQPSGKSHTLNSFLWGQCKIEDAAYPVFEDKASGGVVYLVPASINPNDIGRILRERYDANDMHAAFRDIVTALRLDYLIIDTHPGLNEETLLSIAISDALLIVLRPDQQDFQGTSVTVEVAKRLKVPQINLVVNKVPPDFQMDDVHAKVKGTYGCDVSALIPLSMEVAHAASSSVFCLEHPSHVFSQRINQIVSSLP
jgi:septum site-determining protein MinD